MSDYPDYFGQPGFGRFGSARELQDDDDIDGIGTKTMFKAEGEGVSYGGYIWIADADHKGNNDIQIYVDDVRLFTCDVLKQYTRNLWPVVPIPIFMFYYDSVAPAFGYGISPGITFQKNLYLNYVNRNALTVEYFYHFSYALME